MIKIEVGTLIVWNGLVFLTRVTNCTSIVTVCSTAQSIPVSEIGGSLFSYLPNSHPDFLDAGLSIFLLVIFEILQWVQVQSFSCFGMKLEWVLDSKNSYATISSWVEVIILKPCVMRDGWTSCEHILLIWCLAIITLHQHHMRLQFINFNTLFTPAGLPRHLGVRSLM